MTKLFKLITILRVLADLFARRRHGGARIRRHRRSNSYFPLYGDHHVRQTPALQLLRRALLGRRR
jgi:hypothetical protein